VIVRINERLNLVLTIDRADGTTAYVHSTPISRDIFNQHFLILTKTLNALFSEGFGPAICQRMAARMLQQVAGDRWPDVQQSLMNEIHRLSIAVVPGQRGWETMPYEDAVKRKVFDADDLDTVENALVFFTAASWVVPLRELGDMIYPMLETTSSNATAFAASLTTSTEAENSGATAVAPSASQATITQDGVTRPLSVPS
jgi:hypothetical protein